MRPIGIRFIRMQGNELMKASKGIAAAVFAGALGLAATAVSAFETRTAKPYKPYQPFQAISLDDGLKHIAGYFRPVDGHCKLNVMIGDSFHENATTAESPVVHVQFNVDAGESARFDTASGKQAHFDCLSGGQAMNAGLRDQIASK
jgi:hypothetical protein